MLSQSLSRKKAINMYQKNHLFLYITLWLILIPINSLSQQLGDWTTLNHMNVGRYGNIAVLAYDTIIYTLCGYQENTTPLPVEMAVIKPDGTLSDWSIDSQMMSMARDGAVGFFYNGYVYAIGGNTGPYTPPTATIERTKVTAAGSLNQWEYITPLPKWLVEASLILNPPYVYIIGGWNSTTENTDEIIRGKIQSDGSLGEWSVLTSHLVYGRRRLSTILIDSTIYVVGGLSLDYQSQMNKFEKATLNSDGELSSFEICGTTKTYHLYPALFYDGKHIYVIGGYHGGGYFEYRGERVLINSDGSLGLPEIVPGLQYETGGFGYVQASTGGYVIGGGDSYPLVQFAPFLAPTNIDKKYWEVLE